jgi:hypothetical protein
MYDQSAQPTREDDQHRHDSAGLNDRIEQLGLIRQPLFEKEQMPGRRNREKLRESLDHPEDYSGEPIGHGANLYPSNMTTL